MCLNYFVMSVWRTTCFILISQIGFVMLYSASGIQNEYSKYCCGWAKRGECRANPAFMLVQCQIACHTINCISSPEYYPPAIVSSAGGLRRKSHVVSNPRDDQIGLYSWNQYATRWPRPILQPLVPVHALSYPTLPVRKYKRIKTYPTTTVPPTKSPTVSSTNHIESMFNRSLTMPWTYQPTRRNMKKKATGGIVRAKLDRENPYSGFQNSNQNAFARIYSHFNSEGKLHNEGVKKNPKSLTSNHIQILPNKRNVEISAEKSGKYGIVPDKHRPNTFVINDLTDLKDKREQMSFAVVADSKKPNTFIINDLTDLHDKHEQMSFAVVADSKKPNTFVISDLIKQKEELHEEHIYGRNPPVIQPKSLSISHPKSSLLNHDYYCLFNLIRSGKLERIPMLVHAFHSAEVTTNDRTENIIDDIITHRTQEMQNVYRVVDASEESKLVATDLPAPFNHYPLLNPHTTIREPEHGYNPFANPTNQNSIHYL